jgi:prepilin-type N-terminal cleavage/methylation domain-containing protein
MKTTIRKSGFTLIELLIVIGLLAALAAVLLPNLMGTREDALAGIDKYNAAGTLRTLRVYETVTGNLPDGLHTGLDNDGTALVAGLTGKLADYVKAKPATISALGDDALKALQTLGLTKLAYGAGDVDGHDADGGTTGVASNNLYGYQTLTTTSAVIHAEENWVNNKGQDITFNGKSLHYLMDHEGYKDIIVLFITPTAQWNASGKGWGQGFSMGLDIPATSPITEGDFPYYVAYVGLQYGFMATPASGNTLSLPHLPGPQDNADNMADALEEEFNENFDDDGNSTWVADNDNGTITITATGGTHDNVSVKFTTAAGMGLAKLIGTSSPNFVVTNP